ncbi:MAG: hypothetical protein IKM66_10655 [Clostridia bacterium]|nr:hypothetical protein [Clostridia bacterium]
MFGYIRTHRPELKVCEDEAYKGIYCSLCKELGKRYGIMSRLFLSYDSTFLALALMALSEEKLGFNQKRCPFNPAKKCNFCTGDHDELAYAADISVLLLYHKIRDNIKDSTLFKAILYRILLVLIIRSYKKAEKFRPDAAITIKEYMDMQSAVEEKQSRSIDEAAEPTAILLSKLYSANGTDEDQKRVRERVGYCLGRWIYMIDAFDDIEKDRKSGNYNPFLLSGQDNYEKIKGDLLMTVGELAKAYDLLEIKKFDGITKNVIYDGLYYETLKVYERRKNNE